MLRWAILGTGFISGTVARAIEDSDGSRVEFIVGRSAERCSEFQVIYDIPRWSNDLDVVLADPGIDVVYVGLPNHLHRSTVEKIAASGKAVLCEKSLATKMEDAEAAVTSVRSNQVFFAEGLMYLAHPLYHRLVEILSDGRLGNLRSVNGLYAADISHLVNPLGKGTIYNLGCYPVSLLHLVVQTMSDDDAFGGRTIKALGTPSKLDGNICDSAVVVKFDNGVLANLQSSDSYGMDYGFTIMGDKGALRFVTNPWLPVAGRNHIQWQRYGGQTEDIFVDAAHDAFYHQIKMVETALAAGQKEATRPSPRLQDSLEIMSFMTQWEASCSS